MAKFGKARFSGTLLITGEINLLLKEGSGASEEHGHG